MWILQTFFHWHEIEEPGFSRQFETREQAEQYARENVYGSRHTITEVTSESPHSQRGESAFYAVLGIACLAVIVGLMFLPLTGAVISRFSQLFPN